MGIYVGEYKSSRNGNLYYVRWLNNQYVIYCHSGNHVGNSLSMVFKKPADMSIFLLQNNCVRVNH